MAREVLPQIKHPTNLAADVGVAMTVAKRLARKAAKMSDKKSAAKQEERKNHEIILTRLCERKILADFEAVGIRKLLAIGHIPVLGAFGRPDNIADNTSADFSLANQLKILLSEARADDTFKSALASNTNVKDVNAVRAIMDNRINSFKALAAAQSAAPDQSVQSKTEKKMKDKLCRAMQKVKISRAFRCQQCSSNPCTCVSFKGTLAFAGSHFPLSKVFGRCDTYCIVKYGSTTLLTTQVQKNTYEPVWDERCEITVRKMDEYEDLIVEIFQRSDKLAKSDTSILGGRMYDEYIGGALISAAEMKKVLQESTRESIITRPINHNVAVIGHDKQESNVTLVVIPLHLTDNSFKGKIIISSGSHFPKCDFFGKCDPYCTVTYGSRVLLTTKICKNTYDPVWSEEIEFSVNNLNECDDLVLEVIDHDATNDHDLIGTVVITEMKKFLENSKYVTSSTHVLRNKKIIIGFDRQEAILKLKVHPEIIENNDESGSVLPISESQEVDPSLDLTYNTNLQMKVEIAKSKAYCSLIPSCERPYQLIDPMGRPLASAWTYKEHIEARKGCFSFANLSFLATKNMLEKDICKKIDEGTNERAVRTMKILRWEKSIIT